MSLILEGIVTTINADGSLNVSPMGPAVDHDMYLLVLKPFQTSRTYANLKRTGQGVFHVTDDVELLARAAVKETLAPMTFPAAAVEGQVLAEACRWYAFRVRSLEDAQPRTRIEAEVIDRGVIREFFGFNRAKHAVLEAAILATRIEFIPLQEILDEYRRLKVIVDKTGGLQEQHAFAFLEEYLQRTRKSSERTTLAAENERVGWSE
jgi:hypothetical protein